VRIPLALIVVFHIDIDVFRLAFHYKNMRRAALKSCQP
jgi:hypothetical protein